MVLLVPVPPLRGGDWGRGLNPGFYVVHLFDQHGRRPSNKWTLGLGNSMVAQVSLPPGATVAHARGDTAGEPRMGSTLTTQQGCCMPSWWSGRLCQKHGAAELASICVIFQRGSAVLGCHQHSDSHGFPCLNLGNDFFLLKWWWACMQLHCPTLGELLGWGCAAEYFHISPVYGDNTTLL